MARARTMGWVALVAASSACGPGINVDPPQEQGAVDTLAEGSDAGPPALTSTEHVDVNTEEPAVSPDGGSAGEGTGGAGGGPPSVASETVPVGTGGGNEPLPEPSSSAALVPPMPSMTDAPPPPMTCSSEPRLGKHRYCDVSENAIEPEYLRFDLSDELTLYSSSELRVTAKDVPPPPWLSVALQLTSTKHVEVVLDWTKSPQERYEIRLIVARQDDGCAIVEVPVELFIGVDGNHCDPSE